ncbi:2'-5' RNA ligase family protein [Jiulongibacter sediminis]|nr:2'-5' RNA ligase family protein [Jiulongibacter sediminis]
MKEQLKLFREERIRRLLILFSLPKALSTDISKIKKEVFNRMGPYIYYDSTPHITICKLQVTDSRMPKIIDNLTNCLSRFSSFNIELSGFSTFAESLTFYAEIGNPETFKPILNEIKLFKCSEGLSDSLSITDIPHATIGRFRSSYELGQLWSEYNNKGYRSEGILECVKVLEWEGMGYSHVNTIKLRSC